MKVLLTLLGCVALTLGAGGQDKKVWAKSLLGQKAPELVVEKWLSAAPETKGKFVLLNFWATSNGPSLEAIPELNAWQKKFGDKLVVIGVSDESEENVKKLADPKVEYASAIDTKARMKGELKVEGLPHCLLIDPQGIVQWEGFPFLGGHELTAKVVESILANGK